MTSVKKQIPGMKRLTFRRRSPVTMRIAVRHPSWPRYHPKTTDATAAATSATSAAIAATQNSRTSTLRVHGWGLRPTRKLRRRCRRRVLLMSTQSYPAMAAHRTMISERRRTRSASVAPVRIRSIGARRETVPPSAGEGDFVIGGYLRTLRRDQSHVFRTQW